ncbi:MAG: D-alanine--D-alanine ligase [Lactobacillus sp.]|uniref:D-alanine--D-alanine ligase n=1 Tax=Bombilactobacillus bombi TaxID=1303590 RepID=A0A347STV2_9LACO|nr:D-alanine--D-alanine ligase [Bombilactobacillus bombi]AXX65461.1 D-alanine--D-alanine ligase [Bombilactobacillus bombi]MCO6542423.1 D-alanine--D-alanine ligase [Lactobacillus sp.]RHW52137.1 D-alanine--D-alanine ligase [Bombilactobacillus bombi]
MKIVVLAGGRSTERNVSLSSGVKITNALRSKGYKVALVDLFLGKDVQDTEIDELFTTEPEQEDPTKISDEILTDEKINALRPGKSKALFGPNVLKICQAADMVYLGLHGEDGENGKVQAVLDLFEIRYTGSGTLASGLAMNKKFSKEIFQQNQIPTAQYIVADQVELSASEIPFDFPVVVKPANGGSSVGTHIVSRELDLAAALKDALKFDNEALIEEYIQGREFSVAIVDGQVLPPVEIVVTSGWYDFEHKFQDNSVTHFITPPELDDSIQKQMQRLTKETFAALGMQNYGRIDFLVADDTAYVIEANSLPGMTPRSLIPREAAVVGISYEDLCEKIVQSKLRIYEQQNNN